MVRLALGPAELAAVRMGAGTSPIVEMAHSVKLFSQPVSQSARGGRFAGWRRSLRDDLGTAAESFVAATTHGPWLPDFLLAVTDDLADYLDRVEATPTARISADLAAAVGAHSPTVFQRRLAYGEPAARRELSRSIRRYHARFIRDWPTLAAAAEADLADRARLLAGHGLGTLFDTLHPLLRWRSPYLELVNGTQDELRLDRGGELRLVPSTFIWHRPALLVRPGGPSYLVYPRGGTGPVERGPAGGRTVAELIGPTRTAVLGALLSPATTSQLADRARISLSSASEHAGVLRRAGLVTTRRNGRAVQHSVTELGREVLRGVGAG